MLPYDPTGPHNIHLHVMLTVVNGEWSDWSPWSSCDVTCGDGRQWRGRECNNPPPSNGGADCQGDDSEINDCTELCLCRLTDSGLYNIICEKIEDFLFHH